MRTRDYRRCVAKKQIARRIQILSYKYGGIYETRFRNSPGKLRDFNLVWGRGWFKYKCAHTVPVSYSRQLTIENDEDISELLTTAQLHKANHNANSIPDGWWD